MQFSEFSSYTASYLKKKINGNLFLCNQCFPVFHRSDAVSVERGVGVRGAASVQQYRAR